MDEQVQIEGGGSVTLGSLELARKAREAILAKKGESVLILDVRAHSPVTEYYVVASGVTPPQLKAMMSEVQHVLKAENAHCYRKSGVPDDGWVVLDYVDVVIHIFLKELREYYAIEDLWAECPQVQ